ncbi:hypothetical protein SynRS9909_01563 [Synechococcus sp. RS9909]|uniref:hypothetical protein n=1 Tax=unclassified Synechococcus TaxID=2626047 RepID=UPI000068F89D|nr:MULTISPECIES: hypothetical protein [unclassified Synechococcus]EAQ69196.1 hypothetical protein RS9917_12170 [Synechococcus sp. RS9917]QNI79548.1 hypothetical protein SynRS9909_01563 [Synechococcus sp. RS9909]
MNDLARASLKTLVASGLGIAVMEWADRGPYLPLTLIMTVMFISETDTAPVRRSVIAAEGAAIGVVVAMACHSFASNWVTLSIALLITHLLVSQLRLEAGRGMAYLGCWSVSLFWQADTRFHWALLINLIVASLVGIVMAHLATQAFFPRLRRDRAQALDQQISTAFEQRTEQVRHWLLNGGERPAADRLDAIQTAVLQLTQLVQTAPAQDHRRRRLRSRWRQNGLLWQQCLRHWALLEQQLLHGEPLAGPPLLSNLEQLQDLVGSLRLSDWSEGLRRGDQLNATLQHQRASEATVGNSILSSLTIRAQLQVVLNLLISRALLGPSLSKT